MTEEQKIDRHTDPSGLIASLRHANSGVLYLGDIAAVEKIVREFFGEIITRYDEVGQGVLTPADAAAGDREHALRLGKAFAGQDPAFAAVRDWNGKALADHLRAQLSHQLQPDDDDAQLIAQFFAVLVHKAYDALRELARGADETAVQQSLSATAHQAALDLMGVGRHE